MNSEKFREILKGINDDNNLSKDNIIDKITAELQKKDPDAYEGFRINDLLTVEGEPDEYTLLHLAAEHGYNKLVKFLIENGADVNILSSGYVERTPLHLAALKGHKETAELLLKNKANVNERDAYDETPLHLAARNGHKEMVKLLLQNKADVKLLNNNDETPLHLATRNGHKDVIETLQGPGTEVSEAHLQKEAKQGVERS